jgi:hypothetical protein
MGSRFHSMPRNPTTTAIAVGSAKAMSGRARDMVQAGSQKGSGMRG